MSASWHDVIAEISREAIQSAASRFAIARVMLPAMIGSHEIGPGIAAGLTASARSGPA
jgi:hypothetical protein